jgi:opacity protein-like surface antigen
MSKLTTIAFAACAWAVTAIPAAMAADLPAPVYEPVPVPPAPGGWYLRGDIGYKMYQDPSVKFEDSLAGVSFSNENLDDTGDIGVGVGYRFNKWLRADITADYEWPADFHGTTPCGCLGTNIEEGQLSSWTGLLNVYADLGEWHGFSPYVGGGVGFSYLQMDNIRSLNADGTIVNTKDGNDWNFAWALMAGVAYNFTPNLALDVGYRYLNLGSVDSGTVPAASGTGHFKYDDIAAHEIRVGMRYTMW